MENPKRFKQDLLRDLPDALIFDIFWRLPMTDVVRTSVLSKRWRHFWTAAPFLNFDNRAVLFDHNRLRNFVNRALLCWNGNSVLKFRFHSGYQFVSSMFHDVDLWVNFAQRNGVEELHLHVLCSPRVARHGFDGNDVYCVPPCLYSCSSLTELTLEHCNLKKIYGNVQWNQLKSLRLNGLRANADVIHQILCATPQLEVFYLRYYNKGGNLSMTIQSTSLKKLSVIKYILGPEDVLQLRICAPNLETLVISGIPYIQCLLTDVSSLRSALIGLCHSWQVEFSNVLSQILPTIQHVPKVTLSDCCTKVLGAMKMKCAYSAFPNVKSLELRCCVDDYKQVLGILEMFPQLERLKISDKKVVGHQGDTESVKFEANPPESFLLRLRKIEVTWSEGYTIFPLIEILLKYASKLEKIVFQLNEIKSPATSDSLFLVSQKLLEMRRSSTNCTINLTKLRLQP
ncbi:putative F-box/FBD/LRR-repeat proteinisoform X1 [Salvia divinorum]|uniref:F-box/FBD/LRR-repeat proteinisoform X1 n=1 Tax=Salvia divinorum TaxID=28513 RepID=A0ABD1HCY8_SALDI